MTPLGRRVLGLVIVAIIAVIVLAAALSYLYTATPLAKVTVQGGTVTIEQGTVDGRGSIGVIGISPQIYGGTSEGYPLTLAPGGTFTIQVALGNPDTENHTLDVVRVAEPFVGQSVGVALPLTIPPGRDLELPVVLTVPSEAGSYDFNVTLVSFS